MTRRRKVLIGSWLALLSVWAPDLVAAQATAPTSTTLTVTGDVRTPLSLSLEELKAMPRKRVEVKDEDGRTVAYEGVLVGEILKRAGANRRP